MKQVDVTNNDIIKEKPHPNLVPDPTVNTYPLPTYTWTKTGHTACSATCGTGEDTYDYEFFRFTDPVLVQGIEPSTYRYQAHLSNL